MTKAQLLSLKILEAKANGMDIREAFNAVLGEGTYEKLVSDLYDELRAKAGK